MNLPQVIIEVGLTGPEVPEDLLVLGDPARGVLGTAFLGSADDEIWTDISAWVRSWSVERGSRRGDDPTLRYETGTATIELNDGDRRFDPDNLAGPYVLGGQTLLTPRRRVRIRAVWDGVTYPVFSGFADDWQADYQGNDWTYTTLTASDAGGYFEGYERADGGSTVGGGEDSGARVGRILDGIGWPVADRLIAAGDTTLQATDLSGNVRTELLLVQDTELGELYVDAAGRVVFRNRHAILTDPRSTTPQVVFGDGGYAATGEVPYAAAVPSSLVESLVNTVEAANVGGTVQTAQDASSVAAYLVRSHRRLDLLAETDEAALNWAHAVKYQYAAPRRRWATISFNTPALNVEDVHWPAVLGREFADRVTVKRRPYGGGDPIVRDCFVRGIRHQCNTDLSWTTSFVLQSADRYSFFVLGDSRLGVLGANALAY